MNNAFSSEYVRDSLETKMEPKSIKDADKTNPFKEVEAKSSQEGKPKRITIKAKISNE